MLERFSQLGKFKDDAVANYVSNFIGKELAPVWERMKEDILKRFTGGVPATFQKRLYENKIEASPEFVEKIWKAAVESVMDNAVE